MQRMTIVAMAAMLVAAPAFGQGAGSRGRFAGSAAAGRTGGRGTGRACGAGKTGGGRIDAGITLGGGAGAVA